MCSIVIHTRIYSIVSTAIDKAARLYKDVFGAVVSEAVVGSEQLISLQLCCLQPLADHGVTTVFIDLGNTKIEVCVFPMMYITVLP